MKQKDLLNKKRHDLHGKTVVVTGASSGVGKSIAIELARHGANVVIAARRERALEEVAVECELAGARALVVPADVTKIEEVAKLAAKAAAWGGNIDVWINNAGLLGAGAFEEIPIEVNQKIIETNLTGYINGAHAVLPYFKAQGYGTLINNISVGGWFPVPYAAAYSASKFGLCGFSEALKGELYQWPHIHVCEVFPAFLDTPGIQHAANYTGSKLKPAPPVYDPQKVARAMVRLVRHPKSSTTVGSVATLLKLAHSAFPAVSRRITAGVMELYFKNAESAQPTPGNVLAPLSFGTSVHGGWKMPSRQKTKVISGALLLGGIILGLTLRGRKK